MRRVFSFSWLVGMRATLVYVYEVLCVGIQSEIQI